MSDSARGRTTRSLVLVLMASFVVVNAGNALTKGGDATDFFHGGSNALYGRPLYSQSGPASGFIGPPFQALFFSPFAALSAISDTGARLAWYAVNLVLLACGLLFWRRACLAATTVTPDDTGRDGWDMTVAILAILLPLQTNFEHQNMNPLLLGVLGVGTYWLTTARPVGAGVLFGLVAALKVFPAVIIPYLAARRQWRACAAAVATTLTLALVPMIVTGPASYWRELTTWLRVSSGGWPIRGNNQALVAAADRLIGAWDASGIRTVADAPVAALVASIVLVAMVGVGAVVYSRLSLGARGIPMEVTSVVIVGVLASPIAWDHYWTLLFPAFYLMRRSSTPALLGKAGATLFWLTAVLVSGLNRATVGAEGWDLTRKASLGTIAAVILYFGVLALARAVARQSSLTNQMRRDVSGARSRDHAGV